MEDHESEAGLIRRESSDEEDEEEISELGFNSNPSEDRPGEDEEESRRGEAPREGQGTLGRARSGVEVPREGRAGGHWG